MPLDFLKNIIKIEFNSCVRMGGSSKLRFSRLNPDLRTQGESRLRAFFMSRANGCATTRISDNRLKPYTDEPLYEPRWRELMQGITETSKQGYRKFGSLYEHSIIELHHLVDSRHMLAITVSNPYRGSPMV